MARKKNDDDAYSALTELRKHFVVCAVCKGAYAAKTPEDCCGWGAFLVMDAAMKFNGVIEGKMELGKGGRRLDYLCPDLALHGAAYAMVAQPVSVSGKVEGLF